MRRTLTLLPLLACALGWSTSRADGYRLGQGVDVGDFLLSGYVNLVAEAPRGERARLTLDDLSLFASGHVNRWVNPFVEAEITNVVLAKEGGRSPSRGYFVPERVYDDLHIADSDTLRIGKMLSPVGDWNSVHAAPLVPTTTRPLTTFRGFSEYTTGFDWIHESSSGDGPDWQLYGQPGGEWHPRSDKLAPRRFHQVWGAHINWPLGFADKIGLSFQHGRSTTSNETYSLVGANARKAFGRLSLEGEATAATWSGAANRAHRHEWGAYALSDYRFADRWHLLVEGEQYQDHAFAQRSRNLLLGFAYRPDPAEVWKVEYVHQSGNSRLIPSGWLASYAALF